MHEFDNRDNKDLEKLLKHKSEAEIQYLVVESEIDLQKQEEADLKFQLEALGEEVNRLDKLNEDLQGKINDCLELEIQKISAYVHSMKAANTDRIEKSSLDFQEKSLDKAISDINKEIEIAQDYLNETHSRFHNNNCRKCGVSVLTLCPFC